MGLFKSIGERPIDKWQQDANAIDSRRLKEERIEHEAFKDRVLADRSAMMEESRLLREEVMRLKEENAALIRRSIKAAAPTSQGGPR